MYLYALALYKYLTPIVLRTSAGYWGISDILLAGTYPTETKSLQMYVLDTSAVTSRIARDLGLSLRSAVFGIQAASRSAYHLSDRRQTSADV